MPLLESFSLRIKTGAQGPGGAPRFSINGFPLDFDSALGGTAAGETFEGAASPQSFPHTLLLLGPKGGEWHIDGIEATYTCAGEAPYEVRMGQVILDAQSDLNIWHTRPAALIDV